MTGRCSPPGARPFRFGCLTLPKSARFLFGHTPPPSIEGFGLPSRATYIGVTNSYGCLRFSLSDHLDGLRPFPSVDRESARIDHARSRKSSSPFVGRVPPYGAVPFLSTVKAVVFRLPHFSGLMASPLYRWCIVRPTNLGT